MRSFMQKSKPAQHVISATSSIAPSAHQSVQQLTEETMSVQRDNSGSPRFTHDFSGVPVHARTPVRTQAKLEVSRPGDVYEREADQVADQVMRMPAPMVQRSCAACAAGGASCPNCEEEEQGGAGIHRKAQDSSPTPTSVGEILSDIGPGQPLDQATRNFMEPRFGRDFRQVRVHTDLRAAASAKSVNALAYTLGRQIVFNTGQYTPERESGRKLLAHELTHVVQQWGAAPRRSGGSGGGASGPTQRFSGASMVQRRPVTEDRIHEPIIEQFRQEHGYPPHGIAPHTGQQAGPTDAEIKYGDEYARWLRRGEVYAPSSPPNLAAVSPPLPESNCGTVRPGMPQAQADAIRACVHHARYVTFLAQSISNIAQVTSPYSRALVQLYLPTLALVVNAGLSNPPKLGTPKDFTITNVSVTVGSNSITIPTFTLRLQQLGTGGENGAFDPMLGGIALNEDSGSAIMGNQSDIERTIYHEGIHLLSAVVTMENLTARATPRRKVINRELDAQLTSSYKAQFLAAVAPIWTRALSTVTVSGTRPSSSTLSANQLGSFQWFRVENEIVSRIEEAVYLALRAGRGFTDADLQALPQSWLATAAYWDVIGYFDATAFAQFLKNNQNDINSTVLPVIQAVQRRFLYYRP